MFQQKVRRKLTALLVCLSLLFTTLFTTGAVSISEAETTESVNSGNSSGTAAYTIGDALEILKHLAKMRTLSEEESQRLDLNFDGKITIDDVLIILMWLAKMDTDVDYVTLYRMINELTQAEGWNHQMGGNLWDDSHLGEIRNLVVPTNSIPWSDGNPTPELDFSGTNNQVEGIQEGDIVKTDGKNIYVVAPGTLRYNETAHKFTSEGIGVNVIETDNGDMNLKAKINLPEDAVQLHEMLLYEGKLVVIWGRHDLTVIPTEYDYNGKTYTSNISYFEHEVFVDVYDTAGDFSAPLSSYSQKGQYHSSRMSENNVYLISNYTPSLKILATSDSLGFKNLEEYVPSYTSNGERCIVPGKSIILPEELDHISYTVIGGLDVEREELPVSVMANLGSVQTIYASLENIYITRSESNLWWRWGWWSGNYENFTTIDKFSFDSGEIEYVAQGRVKGNIRNQFNLDEHEGILRVVTEIWGKGPEQSENTTILPIPESLQGTYWAMRTFVPIDFDEMYGLQGGTLYTFDEGMNILAEVHRIGFGESVHSVRFIGDRGYIVTFWQTDPLFAFDLSEPTNPVLLGELKIPGFSRYLHQWDSEEGLLLGFGVDTDDNGVRMGLKITMFDVADGEELNELDVYQLTNNTNNGSYAYYSSPFESEHKSVLVVPEKNIIGFPYIKSATGGQVSGFAFLSYDSENGFTLLGEILSNTQGSQTEFKRGLYIGDYAYAVSNNSVVSMSLKDFTQSGALGLNGTVVSTPAPEPKEPIEEPAPAPFLYEQHSEFAPALADLTVDVFKKSFAEKSDENNLVSPLSILLALAMTANGADGTTLSEMEAVLGRGLSLAQLNEALSAYVAGLPSVEGSKLEIANSIWYRETPKIFTIKEAFLKTNELFYNALIKPSAFDSQAITDINEWVSQSTQGMINEILNPEEEIDPLTIMFLINAIAFDSTWESQYEEKDVIKRDFTKADGSKQNVDFMLAIDQKDMKYFQTENATGFTKDYAGGHYSFAAFLPNEGISIEDYIESMSGEGITKALKSARTPSEGLITFLPKFTFEYDIELNDILKAMGMSTAFNERDADFSKLGTALSPDGNIYIGGVFHKTFIEVDESGTKAAAVTTVVVDAWDWSLTPKQVDLNRPFVFAIVDNTTNTPIFIGALLEI
ncbi:MAG: beta-propeller domain-containing protein [Oscillospiraceae bacterium]|nr:beta-propeller domain-containing protein [Oscillospiraceae bacterium]